MCLIESFFLILKKRKVINKCWTLGMDDVSTLDLSLTTRTHNTVPHPFSCLSTLKRLPSFFSPVALLSGERLRVLK